MNSHDECAFSFAETNSLAEDALASVGLGGDDKPDPLLFARRIGVPVETADDAPRSGVVRRGTILVQPSCTGPELVFVIFRQLAFIVAQRTCPERLGDAAWLNRLAGALAVPTLALHRVWQRSGHVLSPIYYWSHVPETCVALRVGEILAADLWIVDGAAIRHARARRALDTKVIELGAAAKSLGRIEARGFHAARLHDAPSRAAVFLPVAA